jgi:molybdopterin synthase catalytic subunit
VARLDYEAHASLALAQMTEIARAIAAREPSVRLCALHRVGSLAVGDFAVIVAASAPHREQAFAACREAIERIKAEVAIWKKEWDPNGAAHWVNLEGG